jgi:hypothetical protein
VTVEALADRLLATPRGTCVAPDELGAWFGGFNQYKGSGADVSHWLAMHGARGLKVDRKTGDRPTIYIPHAAVCVAGTIQPTTLRRVLLPEFFENGLAARLLVSMPESRTKRWTDGDISDATYAAVDGLFSPLFNLKAGAGPHGDEPMLVDLDEGARDQWIRFVNEHNEQMQALHGHARAAFAKLEGYAARFALIRHCVRQVDDEKESNYVDGSDIEAGITLARWFGNETLRVYRVNTETEEQCERRKLLRLIHRLGGRVTPRDLMQHSRRFPTAEDAETALQSLVDAADGSWEPVRPGARGGRPTMQFVLADSPDFPLSDRANVNTTSESNRKPRVPFTSTGANGRETA